MGTIVILTGTDTETAEPISIYVDHGPVSSASAAWREAGSPQPIEYEADRLILHLDMQPEDGEQVRLVEREKPNASATDDDRQPAGEIDR